MGFWSGRNATRGVDTLMRLAIVALLAVPLLLAVASPLALAAGWTRAGLAFRDVFLKVCHQAPERSFAIAGFPLAVCARCTGFYLGLFAGGLLSLAGGPPGAALRRFQERPRREILLALLIPAAVHPLASRVGLAPDWAIARAATAAVAAAAGGLLLLPALAELIRGRDTSLSAAHEDVLQAGACRGGFR